MQSISDILLNQGYTRTCSLIPKLYEMLRGKIIITKKEVKSISKIIIFLIGVYQKIASPQLRSSCRFEPSCSNYMILAIEKYGAEKGIVMGIQRLIRCRYPNSGIDYP